MTAGIWRLFFAAALVATAAPVFAQTGEPQVFPYLIDTTKVESWSFFTPHPGGGDPTYSLLANRATIGMRVTSRHFDVDGAFQYAQLVGLPRRSSGPGPLGPGASYFDAARATQAYQLYFKALSMTVKSRGLALQIGRMRLVSGAEARSATPAIEEIKRLRLHGRLLGEVEWTPFERNFDGGRLDYARGRWQATAALVLPTQGAYEESASPSLGSLRVISAAVTKRNPVAATTPRHASEFQAFALHYRDRRDVRSRPDNTGMPVTAAAISVTTIGASHVGELRLGSGHLDLLAWAAYQFGDWYGDDHRAHSAMVEGGYRWATAWRPWLRAGLLYASGDGNPADFTHRTFFPLLPTTAPAVFGGMFAQMNVRDASLEFRAQPRARLGVYAVLHRLSLADRHDRWYSGTGATAFKGNYFGYSGRLSSLATSLGTRVESGAAFDATRRWRLNAAVGMMKGGEVIRRSFARDRLMVVSVESRLRF